MEELLPLLSYKLLQFEIAWLHRHSLLNLFELSLKIEQVLRQLGFLCVSGRILSKWKSLMVLLLSLKSVEEKLLLVAGVDLAETAATELGARSLPTRLRWVVWSVIAGPAAAPSLLFDTLIIFRNITFPTSASILLRF